MTLLVTLLPRLGRAYRSNRRGSIKSIKTLESNLVAVCRDERSLLLTCLSLSFNNAILQCGL